MNIDILFLKSKTYQTIFYLLLNILKYNVLFNCYFIYCFCCCNGNRDIAAGLLDSGEDIDAPSKYWTQPLPGACFHGKTDTVELLLLNKADVNKETVDGCTCLYYACQNGHGGTAELLFAHGAHMDQATKGGTPLQAATYQDTQVS